MKFSDQLRTAAIAIEPLPSLARIRSELISRAERLDHKQFTVALFGAFSAGKSSFANALLGDLVLPVSPHPTTAAINRIMPPTDEYPHGTVRVKYKSSEILEHDVSQSAQQVSLGEQEQPADAVADAFATAGKFAALTPDQVPPSAKVHLSFLKAVVKGFEANQSLLGTEQRVDLTAFKKIVAKEDQACFVEWIELFYDCPVTRKQIVLVDTPGADSIHARHTGVAFDYIKNADAILFITYYNHAFSRADEQFLIQLGRVKSAFELDKLFFVINAKDLAKSAAELQTVIEHLQEQLGKSSIASPRIYAVSSQLGVMARLQEAQNLSPAMEKVYRSRLGIAENDPLPSTAEALQLAGLTEFEQDFLHFLETDLTQIAETAAGEELLAVIKRLEHLVHVAASDEQEKESMRSQLAALESSALALLSQYDAETEFTSLFTEVSSLLFYVRQRLFFNFTDYFQMSFHPSLFGEGRDTKQALLMASREFISIIRSVLDDEYRATALRLEKEVGVLTKRVLNALQNEISKLDANLLLGSGDSEGILLPAFNQSGSPVQRLDWQPVFSCFKNARDFFEGTGKAKAREVLEKLVGTALDEEIRQITTQLNDYYSNALQKKIEQLKQCSASAAVDHFRLLQSGLHNAQPISYYEQILAQVRQCIG